MPGNILRHAGEGSLIPGIQSIVPRLCLTLLLFPVVSYPLLQFLSLALVVRNLLARPLIGLRKPDPVFAPKEGSLTVRELSGREHRQHPVVIPRRNRVEFVVMATGTLEGMGEESLPH